MFSQTYKNWTIQQWKSVLYSDESKFDLYGSDGRHYVRRPRAERVNPRYTRGTVKHGGENVMVWGYFSSQGVGPIKSIMDKMTKEVYKLF